MKTYKIRVVEIHTSERDYFINAESMTAAKKMAKVADYIDASPAEFDGYKIGKIVSAEISETDLTNYG